MRNLVSLALAASLGLGAATGALAMFAAMTVDDLYDTSALVVTGEIGAVEALADHREGVLAVDDTLKGASGGEVRIWMRPDGPPVSSSDIDLPVGKAGLWFLTAVPGQNGLYRVDHPQRFVPAAQAQEMIKEINRR